MIQIIHCLYNIHDKLSRDFLETVPAEVPKYCFYSDINLPEVAKHYDPDSEYPYVAMLPGVLVKVPTYTTPGYSLENEIEPGVIGTIEVPQQTMHEHYAMIEPCTSWQHALDVIAIYEENIRKAEAGEIKYNPYPYEALNR